MLIEVIPLSGSIDNRGLTYFAKDEFVQSIRIGCLVEIPFRNVVDYAIVTNICVQDADFSEIPAENLRSIVRIVTLIPLLSPYQIQTIFEISSYYFVHIHHILSLFLSKSLVRYLEKKDFIAISPNITIREKKFDNHLYFYHHTDDTPFFSKIEELAMNSTVIVFPDDFAIDAYLEQHSFNPETTLVIPDKLTETKKYKAFCSVYNGEKKIIIWTRRILYYNLSHYENILYMEDSLHRSAMRFWHTYKHLEILRRIAPIGNFRITVLSTLPSIESMYLLRMGVYKKG